MGSPQYARLILEGEAISGAGAIESRSLLWSDDGQRLAAQELVSWSDGPRTRVVVFDTQRCTRVARFTCGRVLRAPFGSSPTRWCTSVGITVTATKSCD
jgi:hypothetical protein